MLFALSSQSVVHRVPRCTGVGNMGRSPCCEKAHTNKGAWTKEEDEKLVSYIKAHGEGCWRSLPKAAGPLRSTSCAASKLASNSIQLCSSCCSPLACRFASMRKELQAQVDKLPPARPQARQLHGGGRRAHHQATWRAREQVCHLAVPIR